MTKPKSKIKPHAKIARPAAAAKSSAAVAKATPAALLEAVATVLAPLVKLLIARGVTYQVASEMLKRVYVRAGQAHAAGGAEPPTGTQLSLLTGLNRKEIRRLTDESVQSIAPESTASFAAAVHAVWLTQRRFRNKNGAPRILPRKGEGPTFDELVRTVTTDHRPAALLEELLRLALVDLDDNGNVSLRAQPFLSRSTAADRLLPLAENLGDHARAAVSNVLAEVPPYLERSVFSDELSEESVQHLQALIATHWKRLHDELIEQAILREQADAKAKRPAGQRMRVGMYFYSEPKDEDPS